MKNVANTIEDLLEILAGLQGQSKMQIDSSDATIMYSIARQTFKGTALTDRQYALMKEKLQSYKEQFTALDYNFCRAVESLRLPIRHIDRQKYITVVDCPSDILHANDNEKFIAVRFPFRKSEILLIQEVAYKTEKEYYHNKGSHIHYFVYNEVNVLRLLDRFINKEFKIDEDLIDLYNSVKTIHDNPQDYLSGILNMELVNVNPVLSSIITQELGKPSSNNLLQFIDRRFRYGFNLNDNIPKNTLAQKIAQREDKQYHSKPSEDSTSNLLNALWELNRFPMLVVLDTADAENQLYEFANHYRDILNSEEQSVLFRLDDANCGFNQLIKDRKLNNWVDKNTKIVYISKDKLPKLLVNNEWKPTVAISYNSSLDKFVNSYISFNCDLIVFREEVLSPLRRYSKYYA
jgi:hypothetical protein